MQTVNIIGAGRVGRTMLRCLGPAIQDVASARVASARDAVAEAGGGNAVEIAEMAPADIWLLTVPDDQIAAAAEVLLETHSTPSIAIHCSGFHTADEMAPLRAKGWHLASAHPNHSFADPAVAAERFAGTYVGIEGDQPATVAADALFVSLGAETFFVASKDKVLYHAAAVFSNNFSVVLQAVAHQAWAEAGVPIDIAQALGAALHRVAADNVAQLGPVAALTGPAARGDHEVVRIETEQLTEWRAEIGALYAELSDIAERLKTTGRPVA